MNSPLFNSSSLLLHCAKVVDSTSTVQENINLASALSSRLASVFCFPSEHNKKPKHTNLFNELEKENSPTLELGVHPHSAFVCFQKSWGFKSQIHKCKPGEE